MTVRLHDPMATFYLYQEGDEQVLRLSPRPGQLLDVFRVCVVEGGKRVALESAVGREKDAIVTLAASIRAGLGDDSYEPGDELEVLCNIVGEALGDPDARSWVRCAVQWTVTDKNPDLDKDEQYQFVALPPHAVEYVERVRQRHLRDLALIHAKWTGDPAVVPFMDALTKALGKPRYLVGDEVFDAREAAVARGRECEETVWDVWGEHAVWYPGRDTPPLPLGEEDEDT
ncbi:MAG: hypothetical protein ACTHU0_21490 [Kofleriaceae bacterium]